MNGYSGVVKPECWCEPKPERGIVPLIPAWRYFIGIQPRWGTATCYTCGFRVELPGAWFSPGGYYQELVYESNLKESVLKFV